MARYIPPHKRNAPAGDSITSPQAPSVRAPAPRQQPSDQRKPLNIPRDFFHAHLHTLSPLLQDLEALKAEFESDTNVERMFASNRAHSAAITIKPLEVSARPPNTAETNVPSSHFANQFKGAMDEVDAQSGGKLRDGGVKVFLDLGCAPGGFSKWVLEQNPEAKGLGVTLPPEVGGLPMIMEGVLQDDSRYGCIYRDVTDRPAEISYAHPPGAKDRSAGCIPPQCDLVIAGSIYRDEHTADPSRTGPPPVRQRARQQLVFSQLLAALRNLKRGGTLVLVSNMKPHLHNLEILCFLKEMFATLVPVKPKQVHTIRSSFYLVALDFNLDAAKARDAFARLEANLETIACADDEKGVGHVLLLDGSEADIVARYSEFLMQFYEPLWSSQLQAIQRKLAGLRRNKRSGHGSAGSDRGWGDRSTGRGGRSQQDRW
ncbi:hypothetical protein HDU86_002989 [Geranomyces michiganensis]|nr:hypothetical protein HDU86_002989 [Geranomyces michiganensis]